MIYYQMRIEEVQLLHRDNNEASRNLLTGFYAALILWIHPSQHPLCRFSLNVQHGDGVAPLPPQNRRGGGSPVK